MLLALDPTTREHMSALAKRDGLVHYIPPGQGWTCVLDRTSDIPPTTARMCVGTPHILFTRKGHNNTHIFLSKAGGKMQGEIGSHGPPIPSGELMEMLVSCLPIFRSVDEWSGAARKFAPELPKLFSANQTQTDFVRAVGGWFDGYGVNLTFGTAGWSQAARELAEFLWDQHQRLGLPRPGSTKGERLPRAVRAWLASYRASLHSEFRAFNAEQAYGSWHIHSQTVGS
jgi:hypothetical protein